MSTVLELAAVSKTFRMHLQGGIRLPVVSGVAFDVKAGECAVLAGPSGAGKSSILKMIFGTYRCDSGSIVVRHGGDAIDVATAEPRQILELRRNALGYVSQFLRAVPRVAAIDVVAEPLVIAGVARTRRSRRRPNCCRGSTSRSGCGRCRRRRFRAGSSSASTSRAASCPVCRFSCWTSPPPRSTPATVRSWSTWCRKKSGAARPSSRSCTTTTSAGRSPTRSSTSRGSQRRPEGS